MKKNEFFDNISDRKHGKLFDISLNSTPKEEVISEISAFLRSGRKFSIVTPNPEIVLASFSDRKLKEALNWATFSLPDGIGLAMAEKFLLMPSPKNKTLKLLVGFCQGIFVGLKSLFDRNWLFKDFSIIKGRDIFLDLLKIADKNNWRVFLLGGKGLTSQKAVRELSETFKNVKWRESSGPLLDKNANPVTEVDRKIYFDGIKMINEFKPHLLFVGFGAPKQEKWMFKNFDKLHVGGVMAVGGSLSYYSGESLLPPKWMEEAGLEWFWRLLTEPKRLGRMFNAVIVFPLKVFCYKVG